jgi:hypothetical protein
VAGRKIASLKVNRTGHKGRIIGTAIGYFVGWAIDYKRTASHPSNRRVCIAS